MPQQGIIFRALIASPADCFEERKIIPEVIAAWNAVNSEATSAIVEPVKWETHARPEMGSRPQGIINSQLVDRCDMIVGAFWTRLGTPTGAAESGTAEEIERIRASGQPVLLYFSSTPVSLESVDQEQYNALVKYRDKLKNDGLFFGYDSHAEFRDQFQRHFASTMIDLLNKINSPTPVQSGPEDAKAKKRADWETFSLMFHSFLRKLKIEWATEHDSNTHDGDEAKYILNRASGEVLHFRSMILEDETQLSAKLEEALKRIRRIQRFAFDMYEDTWNAFCNEGDGIILLLESASEEITKIIDNIDAPDSPTASPPSS